MISLKSKRAAEGTEEFVNPSPPARLSRRNILALVLSVVGVLLALFFGSRSSSVGVAGNEPLELPSATHVELAPMELKAPMPPPWAPPAPPPSRQEQADERHVTFDEARLARTLIHAAHPETNHLAGDAASSVSPGNSDALVIREGSVMEAALETGINTGRPGAVIARVVRPVRDSRHLRHVLVPAGSQLIGKLQQTLDGEEPRVVVAWTRIVFPNGDTRDLPGLPAMENSGENGLQDQVKRYRAQRFGSAALLALLGGTTTLASSGTAAGLAGSSLALELSRAGMGRFERGRMRRPVVILRPGYRFLVYVSEDLSFERPYTG